MNANNWAGAEMEEHIMLSLSEAGEREHGGIKGAAHTAMWLLLL